MIPVMNIMAYEKGKAGAKRAVAVKTLIIAM